MTPKIQIPKAEIHCHLEGSIPPALAREFDVVEIRRTWYFDSAIRLY